jgi:hypothetical protein
MASNLVEIRPMKIGFLEMRLDERPPQVSYREIVNLDFGFVKPSAENSAFVRTGVPVHNSGNAFRVCGGNGRSAAGRKSGRKGRNS